MDKLNGKWKGFYKYGKMYPLEHQALSIPFSLDINFNGNNFTGTCHDSYTETGFKQPATVAGTFVPNLISFIKKYPSLLTVNEKGEPVVIPDEPSFDIHYSGLLYKGLFSKTIRFEGEWYLTMETIDEKGKKVFYNFSGTWSMKK